MRNTPSFNDSTPPPRHKRQSRTLDRYLSYRHRETVEGSRLRHPLLLLAWALMLS
jgi:hypothetical protein